MSLGALILLSTEAKGSDGSSAYFASIWLYDDDQIITYLVPEKEKYPQITEKNPEEMLRTYFSVDLSPDIRKQFYI